MFKKLKKIFNLKALRYPRVAVVRLSGEIASKSGFRNQAINIDNYDEILTQAFNIPKVKAVALVINSPGGSPVQSELIYGRVRNLAEEKKVPVYSFAEDVAASGGYWLMCSGDHLYASSNSIIGSIGVIYSGFGLVNFIKKMGIDRRVITKGKNKAMLDPFSPSKKEDEQIIDKVMNDLYENFKELVLDRRGKKIKKNDGEIFSGRIWSGKEAMDLGLIDDLGDYRTVMKHQFGKNVRLLHLSKEKSWFMRKIGAELVDSLFTRFESIFRSNTIPHL